MKKSRGKKIGTIISFVVFFAAFWLISCQNRRCNFCDDSVPNWGECLGTVSFITDRTWIVGNQEWSDAVTATNCNKETFNSVRIPHSREKRNFFADCRSNGDYGDLFSWCAVVRFKDILCPDDWRVPTRRDFIILDRALGGTGRNRRDIDHPTGYVISKYVNYWGASFGGSTGSENAVRHRGEKAYYWTQSKRCEFAGYGFRLWEGVDVISPRRSSNKGFGKTLRCVRNI